MKGLMMQGLRLFGWLGVILSILMLASTSDVYAKKQTGSKTSLLKDPNMYTGKASWLYTYQFFPDLDGRLVDSSKIHIPVEFFQHRFSLFAQGGHAGFIGKRSSAEFQRKYSVGLGFNYTHFFTPYCGVKIGLDFIRATSSTDVGSYSDSYTIHDPELDEVRYDYSLASVHEDYVHYQLDFPVEVAFQRKSFSGAFGLKVGVPVDVDYEQNVKHARQTAYYKAYDIKVEDSWVLGCGEFETVTDQSSFSQSPIFVMATADMEYAIPMGDRHTLSIGLYGDYAFAGISPKSTHNDSYNPLENYDTGTLISISKSVPVSIHSESVLSSRINSGEQKIVRTLLFMNVGLRVSFNFNTRPDKK